MGLDIYLEKFNKPTIDTTKTYTSAELYDKDISYITVDDNNIENRLPQKIIDKYCQIVTITTEVIDPEKLLSYFKEKYPDTYLNITTDDTNLCVAGTESADEDEITVIITDYNHTIDKFHASVTITSQNQQFDITKTIPIQVYVYQTEEVDYQRKGLNEYGWSLLPENCTYSTNYDNLIELVNKGGLSRSFLNNWIDGETALMAWW
jgi:hypothetical protein